MAAEKEFTIKFSETEINKHWQKLEAIKQIVNESNLPHQQVVFIGKVYRQLTNDNSISSSKTIKR